MPEQIIGSKDSLIQVGEGCFQLCDLVKELPFFCPYANLLHQLWDNEERAPATDLLGLENVAIDVVPYVQDIFASSSKQLGYDITGACVSKQNWLGVFLVVHFSIVVQQVLFIEVLQSKTKNKQKIGMFFLMQLLTVTITRSMLMVLQIQKTLFLWQQETYIALITWPYHNK